MRSNDPRNVLLHELTRAADGAGRIAAGAAQARHEVSSILENPVGRRALNRLMITPETVRDHPELRRSFDAYITPDGHRSRIDLTQADRIYSAAAMDQVETLRRRTNEFLGDFEGLHVTARISGENAESADIRALIRSDQVQSWYVVPVGVFLVLILTLRDPLACLNLVATMVLTYAFALGATHLLFVTILGAAGIDWKVPYFLFVLLVAVGVDYNVFLMARLREESHRRELGAAIIRAVGQTGGLITSAAAITACSFASFLFSPLELAPTARLRARRRYHDRRTDRPPAAGPVWSLADEAPRRVASAVDPGHGRAPGSPIARGSTRPRCRCRSQAVE